MHMYSGFTPNRELESAIAPRMGSSEINHLPESLISHILGFLPIKDAVRTSILSSEWKHRWTSIANLDVDDSTGMIDFVNLVDQLMLQLKFQRLHKFRVRCDFPYEFSIINQWINTALSRGAEEMEIFVKWARTHSLACDILNCPSLTVLKLCVRSFDAPVSINLPNLRQLHFRDTKFEDDALITKLLSSCPALEELALLSCALDDISVLKISHPLLKKLVLIRNGRCKVKYSFVLDAPCLLYLEFAGYIPLGCTMKKLYSLVEARVDFDPNRGGLSLSNSALKDSAEEFVYALSNVRFLHLSNCFTKALNRLGNKFPVFPELRKLEYGIDDKSGCTLLQDLIENSPQLETIILNFNNGFLPRENVPIGVWDRLKVVTRSWLLANNDQEFRLDWDLKFVRYILKNARVLERFELQAQMSREEYLNATDKISTFPRASSLCKVVILSI